GGRTAMVEVTFLGVGAAVPMRGQTNSSYLVRAGDTAVLVDCGPAVLQQLDAVGLDPGVVTHLCFTHRHGDHTLGYPLFLLWWAFEPTAARPLPTLLASDARWPS